MKHVFGCDDDVIMAVHPNGDLLWYTYKGQGEHDPAGSLSWHPNSGNPVGRGWQNIRHVFGGVSDLGGFGHVIYTVAQNDDLLWYRYSGQGESEGTGTGVGTRTLGTGSAHNGEHRS